MQNGNGDFKRYQTIALQTSQAGRVQVNLLEVRLAIKDFTLHASQENIDKVKERANKTLDPNNPFEAIVNSEAKHETLKRTKTKLEDYLAAFEEVTKLQAARNDLVKSNLGAVGSQIERKIIAITASAFKDQDAVAAFRASNVQRNLLLMRLYATKFLVTNEKAAYVRVLSKSAAMLKNHNEMLAELKNPTRRKLAQEVIGLHKTY